MSSLLSSLPLGVDIGPFTNAMFAGIMLSVFLWGVAVLQTWNYFSSYSTNDKWMLKSFVAILCLDTAATALTVDMAHIYLIENLGSLLTLTTLPIAGVMEVVFNVVIVFLVELFFARRVYLLSQRHLVMPAIIVIFAIAGLVSGICISYRCWCRQGSNRRRFGQAQHEIETALCNTSQALSDLAATFAMSYAFYTSRGHIKSYFLGFAVARGGLVTVAQFLTLALYVAQPTKLNWMPVHFMLGKLCHITMVTILNSRESLRRPGGSLVNDSGFNDTVSGGRQMGASSIPFQLRAMPDTKNGGIASIHVHQVTDYDDSPAKHRV